MGELPEDAIERLIKEAMPDSLITHYIAIFEVTEGLTQELRFVVSDGMTSWLANGMLQGAARMVEAYDDGDYELDDENNH